MVELDAKMTEPRELGNFVYLWLDIGCAHQYLEKGAFWGATFRSVKSMCFGGIDRICVVEGALIFLDTFKLDF